MGASSARPLLPQDLHGMGASVVAVMGRAVTGLAAEAGEIAWHGPRARQASITAATVLLSTLVALSMHLPDVWWAAISGFICTQATRPASLKKAALRMVGTVAGAVLGLLLASWLAYDHLACCLALFGMAALGITGVIVSEHGYAWLFTAITFSLVVLMSLEDPTRAFAIAFYRILQVAIGSGVALLVALVAAPDAAEAATVPPPGWHDLLGSGWPAVLHAVRSGIAVATIPVVWSWFNTPALGATAMTMASVLAVPVLADHPLDAAAQLVEKSIHRLLGCLIGGVFALGLLTLSFDSLVPWMLASTAGVWLFAYVQSSPHGVGYIGTQAAVVFILLLVQGQGPPDSIMPGLDRFAGIICGLLTLYVVSLLVQPVEAATSA